MDYPKTERVEVTDEFFGTPVSDPYRWLEKDHRSDEQVARWIEAQNDTSSRYLAELNGQDIFRKRLTALFDHERLSVPEKRGGRYFFTRNDGLDKQAVLVMRESHDGPERVVIDPNSWSEDGATALAEWAPSVDGKLLAYAIQEGGADWRTIHVLDLETGKVLSDKISWARFTQIAWVSDGSGFFYSRNPVPVEGAEFGSPVIGHAVYFHRLGTSQADDRLIRGQTGERPLLHWFEVTTDGRFAAIYSTPMTGGNSLSVIDLHEPDWTVRAIIEGYDHGWSLVGAVDTKLFLSTQENAERGKIVTFELADRRSAFTELIAQKDDAVLLWASIIGERLVVAHMVDAKTQVERYKLDGTPDGGVRLPGVGTAGAFRSRAGDDEAFFVFTSYDTPTAIYRYRAETDDSAVWAAPKVDADLDAIAVEQRFFASLDGTRVPIFIVRHRDTTTPAPTMLTAYGGFGIPMVPFFSPEAIAWVEQGGVFAVANIRGGGEYGDAWHHAGRLQHKRNVFDDFIAAAEFLIAEQIASVDGLAIQGGSNGGLLIGAVVNQRPDLFAAALADVGVMDMLRFNRFTGGQLWVEEFGDPQVEAHFDNLRSYSPLHNIRDGRDYPAILVTTADTDDRVVPSHSFKYVATLQAENLGSKPRLLRVETRAGHGAGKPVDKMIEKTADMWAFAARWTGLDPERSATIIPQNPQSPEPDRSTTTPASTKE